MMYCIQWYDYGWTISLTRSNKHLHVLVIKCSLKNVSTLLKYYEKLLDTYCLIFLNQIACLS